MFAAMTYTDCAADESVSGRTGFQFQAASPEATPTDEERIRNGLLHVVPMGLSPDHPETHPPTCAYAAIEGRYYLCRGRSTGQTLSGRPGNQVTEAIVTGSPGDILPLRPAQLFSSPTWTLRRASTQRIAGWEAPLEIDPDFETSGLHAMVTSDPWLRQFLPNFLTMCEAATASPRVKLILVHPDQVVVMRWIALASLFEDGARALDLSFRVFSANPISEVAHIVGAHPLLSPDLSPANASGCNLVDIQMQTATTIPASRSATKHAAWFLENDPYEALDAIETSRRWARLFAADDAALAASVACLAQKGSALDYQDVAAALTALSALARAGAHDELEAYGDAILDAVVARAPQRGEDFAPLPVALWDVNSAKEDALASGLALVGLEWAVQVPAAADSWAQSHVLPRVASEERRLRWHDPDASAHAATLLRRILVASPENLLAAWFSLANALETGLSVAQAGEPVDRLARHWASRPELTPTAFTWLQSNHVIARLQVHLRTLFETRDRDAVAALMRGDWDWLVGADFVLDPEKRPLSPWLVARTLDAEPLDVRLDVLRRVSPLMPDWASPLFLERRATTVEAEEIAEWLRCHPDLTPSLAQLVEDHATSHLHAQRRRQFLVIMTALADNAVGDLSVGLSKVVSAHLRIQSALADAQRLAQAKRNPGMLSLSKFPVMWLTLNADSVAECLVTTSDDDAIATMARVVEGRLDTAVERFVLLLAKTGDVQALVGTLRLMADDPKGLGKAARRALAAVWIDPTQGAARRQMLGSLPENWRPLLEDFEASLTRGRLGRTRIHGARRLETKDGA